MSELENPGTNIVPVEMDGSIVTDQEIEASGLMMPRVAPAVLREAFAYRQKVLTSVLDPNRDFIYSIRYFADGKQKQMTAGTLDEAKKHASFLNGTWSAHPKKSGVLKIAHALGIQCRLVERTGLPLDQRANFSFCTYQAVHSRTGHTAEGQGYCDKTERDKVHALVSMADTRAYCHAVLRCAGYDQVGAESLDVGDGDEAVTIQHQAPPKALVPETAPKPLDLREPPPKTQAAPAVTESPKASAETPAPAPTPSASGSGVITNAMAALLSKKMLDKLGSREKCREWLMTNFGYERSVHVPEDKYQQVVAKIDAVEGL